MNDFCCSRSGFTEEDTAYGFTLVLHYPKDMDALGKRVAQAHADAVIIKIKGLNCSSTQKLALTDAIIQG